MGQTLEDKRVFRAELHVHTPSSNCYKGPKTDDEFLRIIDTACNNKIDILAITDHNSICGYKRLCELKQKINNEYSALISINDSKEAKTKTKQLHQTLSAFDSVLLIPGVEFEVNNGIHLLVLFNPETPISTIEQFLLDGGYDDKSFGKENDAFSCWSIFDLYKESKKYDCIVIDAHSDSNKGILNTLGGQPRVHAFIDPCLLGICYKNEKQKNNIENLISQFSRKTPVAFLKSSDAHHINEIGRDLSFFRLAEKNWSSFKDAFYNPEECVFTTYPETHSILKKVASSGSCIFINNLGDDTKELLFKSICGLANSDGGFIFIGAESINSINGLPVDKIESYESVFKEIIERIPGLSDYRINGYPIKDKSLVFVLKVSQSDDLISIEDDYHIYFYKDRKIEVLNAAKVQSLITQRLTSRFSDKINTELDSIRKKTTAIDTFIKSLPILNSFFNRSVFLTSVTSNIEPITPIHLTTQQFVSLNNSYEKHSNGLSRGNVFYLDDVIKPRLSDAYLRITLPRYYLKGIKALKGEPSLYMVPGGAVFYSDNPLNCFYRTMEPVLKIEINKDYPIKFLCAYLKSSFYLWYLLNKYNTLDIIPPSSFNNIRIPQLNLKNPKELSIVSAVEQLVDQITCAEKAFLLKQNSVKDPEELYKVTVEHNESVKTCFETIDDLFYSLLAVSDNEKLIIQDNLRVNSIFVPNQVNSIH